MAKFDLGFGRSVRSERLQMAAWFIVVMKLVHIISLTICSVIGRHFMRKGPVEGTPMITNSTEAPLVFARTDVLLFIFGFNSDHGALVSAGILAYLFAETCALPLCVRAILNNYPRALRPEIVLNFAYATLQISAAIILSTAIAMFGLEWLVQMMVNSKHARGIDLTPDYIDEIRRRMPIVYILILILVAGWYISYLSALILDAYKRYLGEKIAAGTTVDLG